MINIKKERLEIPIYFGKTIDEESIRETFEFNLKALLDNEKKIIESLEQGKCLF
jgi:hypothetical protein